MIGVKFLDLVGSGGRMALSLANFGLALPFGRILHPGVRAYPLEIGLAQQAMAIDPSTATRTREGRCIISSMATARRFITA